MFLVIYQMTPRWLSGIGLFLSHLLNWHAFGVLALIPGLAALFNQLTVDSQFNRTKKEVNTIADRKKNQRSVFVKTGSDLEDYRPRRNDTLLGALLLTIVFELVAGIGGTGRLDRHDLGAAGARSEMGASEDPASKNKTHLLSEKEAAATTAAKGEAAQARSGASANNPSASRPESPTVRGLTSIH
jgi:hypothetical protein